MMKRLLLTLVLVFTTATLFAGGKECNLNKQASRNVELTGTFSHAAGSDATIFTVANSSDRYTVCEKSKADLSKLGAANVRVKGKLISCEGKQELMIENAWKI
jgi:hypothetical protein